MWAEQGTFYFPALAVPVDLPPHVFAVRFNPQSGFFLSRVSERYELPEKLYDIEPGLVERILNTHQVSDRSVGVLLTGLKGTGKSVIAKQVCNRRGLPVVVVDEAYDGIEKFLAGFDRPAVVLFDEFEKVFGVHTENDRSEVILRLLDGATGAPNHLYLMTANTPDIGEFFVDRPSRIRYRVNFESMSEEVVRSILRDRLHDASLLEDTASWIATRTVITVDAVCAAVDEINLYGLDVTVLDRWFNLNPAGGITKVYRRSDNRLVHSFYGPDVEGQYFQTFEGQYGRIAAYDRRRGTAWMVVLGQGVAEADAKELPDWLAEDIQIEPYFTVLDFFPCEVRESKPNAFRKRTFRDS